MGRWDALVSVVIPCYNQARFLDESIASVMAQTHRHFEIVVVDDGSTDHIAQVLQRHPDVRSIRQENTGTAAARNRGVLAASGEYVVVLDADDRLLPHAIEAGLAALEARPDAFLAAGRCRLVTGDGQPRRYSHAVLGGDDVYATMLALNRIPHPAQVLFRVSVFARVQFDQSLRVCSDYDFYLKVMRELPVTHHGELISEYRQHDANKSLDAGRNLGAVLAILDAQRPWLGSDLRRQAWQAGRLAVEEGYWKQAVRHLLSFFLRGSPRRHLAGNVTLAVRLAPRILARIVARSVERSVKRRV